MRKIIAAIMVAGASLVAGQAMAADLPYYPPPELPPVDYELGGSFYLRASLAGNMLWAQDYIPGCPVACAPPGSTDFEDFGYGYSFGAGVGYETGTGFRADVTLDRLYNEGLTDGDYELELRSTILLANAYYDFAFSDYASAAGGFGAYVGAGIGGAYNEVSVTGPIATPDGESWSPAAAVMAGVTYDMGAIVADLGYRGIYMPEISNSQVGPSTSFYVNDNFIHEVRGTLRYRF